jgi:hypothetical protein
LRNVRELKKTGLEKEMVWQKEVCPCEHELESFLRKTEEADIEFKEDLIEYSGNESQLRKLRMRSSKGTLESHGFKTNILCVNVGYIDEGQLSNVVTEEEKRKIWLFKR